MTRSQVAGEKWDWLEMGKETGKGARGTEWEGKGKRRLEKGAEGNKLLCPMTEVCVVDLEVVPP